MLLSMTGFGEARRQEGDLAVAVELRTINSRYFKLSLRATDPYGGLEPKIESLLRGRCRRGTVQVNLRIDRRRSAEDYRINRDVLGNYRRQLESLTQEWHLADPVPVEALLQLPGVIEESGEERRDVAADWPPIEAALQEAVENLSAMRAAEGEALAADLAANCQTISARLDDVARFGPQVAEQYRERLLARVNKVLESHGVTLESGDVIREVSLLAERADVSEEIVRLRSHLEQFGAMLQSKESSGRKLDFLTQEMFREANTIGSKAGSAEIGRHVIEIKAAIERMREQVQNVE